MKRAIALALFAAIALPQQGAIATPTFYWQETPTAIKVTISGLTPNSTANVSVSGFFQNVKPKYCGYVRVKYSTILLETALYFSNGIETDNQTPYFDARCTGGVWKNQLGQVVTPPQVFYDSPDVDNSYLFVQAAGPVDWTLEGYYKTSSRKTNGCGMATVSFKKPIGSSLTFSPFVGLPDFSVSSAFASGFSSPANIPTICRKVGGSYVRYIQQR